MSDSILGRGGLASHVERCAHEAGMKGDAEDCIDDTNVVSAAAIQSGLGADASAADEDQTAADADQSSSDADQIAAALDIADAASDQRAADQDQASADRSQAGSDADTHRATRLAREITTTHRSATQASRTGTSHLRSQTAARRDTIAASRDETARRRDLRAEEIERNIAASDAPLVEKLERLRARAATDRARAARDRADAARERVRLESELLGAHLDDLTGAYRREMGWRALSLEIDHARRGNGRFVLAFVDVDGLKGVNDRDGHAAGDNLLQTLVRMMRLNLRSFDPVVRYGGDEFVCGLGGVEVAEVARRFDLIDRSLRDDSGIGISVGIAELANGETLDDLTVRADAALLDSRKGRGE